MNKDRTYVPKWNNPFMNTIRFYIGRLTDLLSGIITVFIWAILFIFLLIASVPLFLLKLLNDLLDKVPRG